ncbi:MAG: site-specific integrase [Alphaproteobacteria bacterium]
MKTKIINTEIYRHKSNDGTVALKSRKNGNNPESLYLEIYEKATQKRHLQFLDLYFSGNEALDIQAKTNALSRCTSYDFHTKKVDATSFTDFFKEQIARIDNIKSRRNPNVTLRKLYEFTSSESIPFSKVNENFLLSFREWLLNKAPNHNSKKVRKTLEKGTADLHMACLMRFANRAQRKGLISTSAYTAFEIPPIGQVVKVPITLTDDEIKKLQNTPYPTASESCKALMLQFACGQRWGDIRSMTWEQIVLEGAVYKIVLQQEKTDKVLPSFITKGLIDWIGESKERKGQIFTGIPKSDDTVRRQLQKWCKAAGIQKRVGTHTMRRSCATILFKKEVPLYTISKILGHSSTDITLRYIGIDETDIRKGLNALKDITDSFSYNKAS